MNKMSWNVTVTYLTFFPPPLFFFFWNSLICFPLFLWKPPFFFFFFLIHNVSLTFYLITGDADSIKQCWKNALKRFWEERDPRKHLLSLHTFSWRLSALLRYARKCLLRCDRAELQLMRKKGAFDPTTQWLSCVCWIEYWKRSQSSH